MSEHELNCSGAPWNGQWIPPLTVSSKAQPTPTGWKWQSLRELAKLESGHTPSRYRPDWWGGDVPWLALPDIRELDGKVAYATIENTNDAGIANSSAQILPAGSVCLSRTASVGFVTKLGRPMATSQDFVNWVCGPDLDPDFLLHLLIASRGYIRSLSSGSTHKTVYVPTVKEFRICCPLLPEQKRIAGILAAAEGLRRLRAQADRRAADFIPALFDDMFGDANTSQFPALRLSEVAQVVSGVAKGRKLNGSSAMSVPYIRVANVQAGYLDLREIKQIEAFPAEVQELLLRRGDVLLTEGGDFDKLGRGAMWETEIPNCIHQNHVFRVRLDASQVLPVYFTQYLRRAATKAYFLRCAKKTTNLASINMKQLRALPVTIPPIRLQHAFATRIAKVRAMETKQAECRSRLDDLFQSLLHRAFSGQL